MTKPADRNNGRANPGNDIKMWRVLYAVFGLLAFAIQDALIKDMTVTYPVLQLLSIRSVVVLLTIGAIALVVGGVSLLKTSRPGLLMLRGVFAFFAFTLYYIALAKMPLADSAAIYMTAPLFVTALSVPLLREQVGMHRATAVTIGFIAAIVMIGPGSTIFQAAAILPLFSAMLYAFIPVINRHVGVREHPLTMGVYTMLSYMVLSALTGILIHMQDWGIAETHLFANIFRHWRPMATGDMIFIVLSGCIFVAGLLGLTQSYRVLPVSIVAPFEYSYLIWATAIGYIAFSEVPQLRTIIGGLVIVACGCYIALRENRSVEKH